MRTAKEPVLIVDANKGRLKITLPTDHRRAAEAIGRIASANPVGVWRVVPDSYLGAPHMEGA